MFLAIDRVSKFTYVEFHDCAGKMEGAAFLRKVVEVFPYQIHIVLDDMLAVLAREADLEWLMIDSTIVRAHQHAAGARKQKGGRMPKAWVGPEAG